MSGLKLRPYQDDAADFLFSRDRALILAPVGAGKTALTLAAMADMIRDGHARRWLVLAPKRVCTDVWPVEAPKWAPSLRLALAVGSAKQRAAALASDADVIVTNYDTIQTLPPLENISGIVFDELTRLKSPSGKRFKALEKLIANIPIRWGLTGSFTSNGLEDVFGQCKIVDERLLGRAKGAFLQKYFVCINRDFGEWQPRRGALEQVMAAIKPATFVLEPGEYKDKLPPLNVVEMKCDMADRGPYEKMKRQFVLDLPTAQIVAASAAAVTTKLQQLASGFIYHTDTVASARPGKFDVSQQAIWFSTHKFDLLDDILAENQRDNTIVFYNFKEELAELRRRYPHLQTLDDKNAVERWNKGKIEILAAHPKSAQFGLNLQFGGNKMVFLSLPWSLVDFEQAIGRLHRSGQTRDVWVYLVMANKTIDETILTALQTKRSISDVAMEALS
jgi:SNF2 family DNA or RNA helicase